jgi:hypothetical protein
MNSCPNTNTDGPDVQFTAFAPDKHIIDLLAEGDDPAPVLVLPRRVRADQGVYQDVDLTAVKTLRHRGVQIDFLHPPSQRTFQGEYSVELVVVLLIFIRDALGEQVVQELARYLWDSIRNVSTPPQATPPPVTVELNRYVQDGDRRELQGLRISGQDAEQVVEAFKQALRQELPPRRED